MRKLGLMLIKQLKKILESESRSFYAKNKKEILDILLFGSVIKGKKTPQDIDVLIIFKEKKNFDLTHQFRLILEPLVKLPIEVTGKSYAELFEKTFLAREAILSEGYSLIYHRFFSQGLGFVNKVLFHYNLKEKSKSERMRFYYSLYGRNTLGILKTLSATKFTDTVILCPVEHQEEMKVFFHSWQIEFEAVPVLMPGRLS